MSQAEFDPIAEQYDSTFSQSVLGQLQRAVVYRYLDQIIQPGLAVLELNCGTGVDALWLARKGCRVRATDLSAEMLKQVANKAEAAGLQANIETAVQDIRSLQADRQYSLIFSNFGGLNCLAPEELKVFGSTSATALQPGGHFVAVVMGRYCWWESVYFGIKGRLKEAIRRWNGGPVDAPLGPGFSVKTWYYAPAAFGRYFPKLQVRTIQPVGFWLPPSYLNTFFERWPGLLRLLNFFEKKCRGRLWASAADHFMIVFQKER